MAFISIIVFGLLTIIKFKYAKNLNSQSLHKDGICSLIGTCLGVSLFSTTAIIESSPNAWYIDPIVSLLIGVSAIFYGFRSVSRRILAGEGIHRLDWWYEKKSSQSSQQELSQAEKGGDYVEQSGTNNENGGNKVDSE